jgi:hypothetical protein
MKDIDELLEEINNASVNTETKSKNKKKKGKVEENIVTQQHISLNTDDIVKTIEVIKLGDPTKVEQNIQNVLEKDIITLNQEYIKTESVVKLLEEDKAKKKKRRKKKKNDNKDANAEDGELDEEVTANAEEKINKWKNYFDFSGKDIKNTRFQDNSHLVIINNWEDIPWNQT